MPMLIVNIGVLNIDVIASIQTAVPSINNMKPTTIIDRNGNEHLGCPLSLFGRGDDTVGNPHRAQIFRFDFFELVLLLNLDKQLPVEQFEAAVSQSTVPPPPLLTLSFVRAREVASGLSNNI